MPAVGAEHDVFMSQVRANARRHSFFPDVGMTSTVDFARCIELDKLLFCAADTGHRPV